MDGNEYATEVWRHFCKLNLQRIMEETTAALKEAYGTGFCAGVAFANALPLKDTDQE